MVVLCTQIVILFLVLELSASMHKGILRNTYKQVGIIKDSTFLFMFQFQGKVIFRFLPLHNFVKQTLCKCMFVACNFKQMFVFAFSWKPGIYAFLSIPSCNVCFTFELFIIHNKHCHAV